MWGITPKFQFALTKFKTISKICVNLQQRNDFLECFFFSYIIFIFVFLTVLHICSMEKLIFYFCHSWQTANWCPKHAQTKEDKIITRKAAQKTSLEWQVQIYWLANNERCNELSVQWNFLMLTLWTLLSNSRSLRADAGLLPTSLQFVHCYWWKMSPLLFLLTILGPVKKEEVLGPAILGDRLSCGHSPTESASQSTWVSGRLTTFCFSCFSAGSVAFLPVQEGKAFYFSSLGQDQDSYLWS